MVYNELEQGDILSKVRVGLAPIAYTDIPLRSIWAVYKIRQTPDEYYDLTGKYEPFEGICLVDTFELAEDKQFSLFTTANTERVKRQRNTPIFVIISNPPYN